MCWYRLFWGYGKPRASDDPVIGHHRYVEHQLERMLKFFAFDHLRLDLQEVSRGFADLAHHLVDIVPAGPERTVALRKLLEAKDAAVRAVVIPD